MGKNIRNLYVHFPFCRRKCTYCALYSNCARPKSERDEYARCVAESINLLSELEHPLSTIYFGGGSPALCDLKPVLNALEPFINNETEFSVELHPHDATPEILSSLKSGGVNRISMGLQSTNDDVLRHMNRRYTLEEGKKSFSLIKKFFDNAGIDLIVGYPTSSEISISDYFALSSMGLTHCSVYSLILEDNSTLSRLASHKRVVLPSDETTLDQITQISSFLRSIGLNRYEISNYAATNYECRHNLATWRGEDYIGLGIGAHGRIGLRRTRNFLPGRSAILNGPNYEYEDVSQKFNYNERKLFRLRTTDGIDANGEIGWIKSLNKFAEEGLVEKKPNNIYTLTSRGTEVCDSIIAELL